MTKDNSIAKELVFVAIDVAKLKNDVLVELPNGSRKMMKVMNNKSDFVSFLEYLKSFNGISIRIGLEPTSNYHRPICYFLETNGFKVNFVSSIAVARTREAIHNSWDKNDKKDAQVILHMLKQGIVQNYHDPKINNINDIQELSKTHFLISLRKTKTQHSILTHYLPLYFPEVEKYFCTSRAEWFFKTLYRFPSPHIITNMTEKKFIKEAWDIVGRKVNKENFLKDFYQTAKDSIGIPIEENSASLEMYKVVLNEALQLCQKRSELEARASEYLHGNPHFDILKSVPGIGPILALTIIAESGDINRFGHYRQYLKYAGMDLSTEQSGQFRGQSKISKRGNARLRSAFWMAGTIAIRMGENGFSKKYNSYTKKDPKNADLKRKANSAVAAKMCRITYFLIKNNTIYRPYFQETIPSGGIRSVGP
jgi:transposase